MAVSGDVLGIPARPLVWVNVIGLDVWETVVAPGRIPGPPGRPVRRNMCCQ
jgi:hypothetical protein